MKNAVLLVLLAAVGCNKPKANEPAQATPQTEAKKPTTANKPAQEEKTSPVKADVKPELAFVESKNPFTEFLDNEAIASEKFAGKGLEAFGAVSQIRKAKDGNGWVVVLQGYGNPNPSDSRGYYCRFKDSADLAKVKVMQCSVRVRGKFSLWKSGPQELYVDDCKLTEVMVDGPNGPVNILK